MRSVRAGGGYSAHLLVAAALLAGAGLAHQRPANGQPPPATRLSPPAADASITADDLRREVGFLASDAMRGRLTATPENAAAARYIAEQFERHGLRAVDPGASYRHTVDLVVAAQEPGNTLLADAGGQVESAELSHDFFPAPFSAAGSAAGPVAFAGFGITAAGLAHDDYRQADVNGKVVLLLDHEPGEFDPQSRFAGVVRSEHGSAIRKVLEAQRRGAIAVAIAPDVHNHARWWTIPDLASRAWPSSPPRVPPYQLAAWVDQVRIPVVRISAALAERLAAAAGRTLQELGAHAETAGGAAVVELSGVMLEMTTALRHETTPVDNVVGLIEGADPALRDEWIIVCAHYDHEGAIGTRIFNGADDDASGVAGLLEIAEAYAVAAAAGRRPRRSILLAAWNAEEQGLLGAWGYTERPLAPLEDTVAVINMDMIGRSEEVPAGGGYPLPRPRPPPGGTQRNRRKNNRSAPQHRRSAPPRPR
ncbi:MAG: M28 family peptidase, partial [Acidobacteria bacterium]|nr:M28 family peptidase [Acidobacteriota bacterium]